MGGRRMPGTGIAFDIKLLHMGLLIVLMLTFFIIQCVAQGSIIFGGGAIVLSGLCFPFVSPAFRKIVLPFVPATTEQVNNVIKALNGRKGTLVDLGSGDGRIVIEAAKHGFQATGVELNPWLVLYSRVQAIRFGLSSIAMFKRKDIWKTDLSLYDNVVVFGVDSMMKDLEDKCRNELKPSSAVAACRFAFPNRMPTKIVGEGLDTVWLYDNSRKETESSSNNGEISHSKV